MVIFNILGTNWLFAFIRVLLLLTVKGSVKRYKREGFLNGEDKFSLRETFGLVEKETGYSAPRRGELSSFCLRRVTFFSWRKMSCSAPRRGSLSFVSDGSLSFLGERGTFRAPARVTFGHSPKSDQKVCLKPQVSRLPARYALWFSAACTARSRGFSFVVRIKGLSLRLRRCR